MDNQQSKPLTFVVPASAGEYATQVIVFTGRHISVTFIAEGAIPTGASIELWLRKLTSGVGSVDPADFIYSGQFANSAGMKMLELASWPGCMLRVKSGGTSGSVTIHAATD